MLLHTLPVLEPEEIAEEALLDRVFFALSDPARRSILGRFGDQHCWCPNWRLRSTFRFKRCRDTSRCWSAPGL